MQPQLAAIVNELERARAVLSALVTATPDERWALRAHPDRWSVAECVAHLNLTSRAYVPLLREAFAGQAAFTPPPSRYRRDLVGWLVGSFTGPLPRIGRLRVGRIRTRPGFVPSGPLPRERVVAEFETLQDEQIELTRAAEGRPLERIRIVSPFDARLSYNAYSCLWLLPRHQHRHLEQAALVWREGR